MSDRFAEDSMEDLALDEAEGSAEAEEGFDEYEGGEGDEGEGDESDEFLRGLLGRVARPALRAAGRAAGRAASRAAGGLLGGAARGGAQGLDDFEGEDDFDAYDDDAPNPGDAYDSMEDAVADALAADDTDEFLRRLRNVARRAAQGAARVGRGVGQAARVIAPIARAIPLPQAQAVGRIAGALGRVLFDGADEFDALDEVFDELEGDDAIDAAAPVVAGLALRSRMPGIAQAPRHLRQQMVRSAAQATRRVAAQQGIPTARHALSGAVQRVQQAVRRRAISPRQAPQALRQLGQRAARNPRAARALAQQAQASAPAGRRAGRGGCPHCGRTRNLRFRGPVHIAIRGR